MPEADLVALPLFQRAQVRVTYFGEGEDRRLLRFEIATSVLDGRLADAGNRRALQLASEASGAATGAVVAVLALHYFRIDLIK